jgi:hypothetical protein
MRILGLLSCLLSATSALRAQEPPLLPDTVAVADRFLWGPAETVGLLLDASFLTEEARAEALDLRRPLGLVDGEPVLLGAVLLSLNLAGNGFQASWRVIGPRALLTAYLEDLRTKARTHTGIHSLDAWRFPVACACD